MVKTVRPRSVFALAPVGHRVRGVMKKGILVLLLLLVASFVGWWALQKTKSPEVSVVQDAEPAPLPQREPVASKKVPPSPPTHSRRVTVAAQPPELKDKFALVDSLARDGRRAEVLELLQDILNQAPENAEALYLMGYYLGEDPAKKTEAIASLAKALERDPSHDGAMGELIVLSGGVPSKEIYDGVRSAYERNPGSSNLAAGMGKILVDRGEDAAAIPLLEKSSQDPQYTVSSLNTLVEVYRDGGDFAKTAETYDRLIAFQEERLREANSEEAPMYLRDVSSSRLGKVDVLIRSGDLDGAERVLRQIRSAEPENPDIAILQQQLDRARG